MENKEQKIKMILTAIDNESKRIESIEAAINKVSGELVALKEEFERKNSEVWYRYKTLSAAQRSAKEYIENCYKQLAEVSANYYGCEGVAEELQR